MNSPISNVRIPVPYLSIGEFSARREFQAPPGRIRVTGFYHNYNRKTVSGASFSIDRWNGNGWTNIKSGTLTSIAPNKGGSESVDLPLSKAAMKFRFVLSKSVEGAKEYRLSGEEVGTQTTPETRDRTKPTPQDGRTSKFPPPLGTTTETTDRGGPVVASFLSIDQFYANRFPGGILVGALLVNKTKRTAEETPYAIYQSKGTGWTKIKSGRFKAVKAGDSVFESVSLPASNDAMKFKIEASLSVQGKAECSLQQQEAKIFVVQYRCPEWQILPGWRDRTPLEASKRMKGLNGLGFDTKYSYASDNLTVYYRSVNWHERTFSTRAAAQAFQDSRAIAATLPNREYADVLPPAVEVKIVER